MRFQLNTINDKAVILDASGSLDARSSQAFQNKVRKIVRQGTTGLVVDLSDVSRIDSSGLSALVSSFRAIRENGGSMALVGLNEAIRYVFSSTRLDHVFPTFERVDLALQMLGIPTVRHTGLLMTDPIPELMGTSTVSA